MKSLCISLIILLVAGCSTQVQTPAVSGAAAPTESTDQQPAAGSGGASEKGG